MAPSDVNAWDQEAYSQMKLGKYDDALSTVDRALVLDDHSALAWSYKAKSLHQLRRYDEALAAWDKALAIDPDNAELRNGRALTTQAMHHNYMPNMD